MIKKYWHSQFKWLFLSGALQSIGSSLFGIVLLMMIADNFTGSERGWLITAASFVNIIPSVLNFLTGYYADKTSKKIRMSRIIRCVQMFIYVLIALFAKSLSIYSVIFILVIISFSKVSGSYAGGLLYEKEIEVVDDNDREQIISWSSGSISTLSMVSQLIGPSILVLINYKYEYFALLNALIFGISALLLGNLSESSRHTGSTKNPITEDKKSSNTIFLGALKTIFSIPLLGCYISVYAVAGIVGSALENVFSLYFANYQQQQISSFGFTIALVGVVFSVAEVLGALFPLSVFKKISFLNLVGLQTFILLLGVVVAELFLSTYVFLVLLFLAGFLQGKAGPKLNAWIMNQDITDNIALSLGLISTTMTFTLPIGQLIFMSVANIWTVTLSLELMAIYMLVLLAYIVFINYKVKKSN